MRVYAQVYARVYDTWVYVVCLFIQGMGLVGQHLAFLLGEHVGGGLGQV